MTKVVTLEQGLYEPCLLGVFASFEDAEAGARAAFAEDDWRTNETYTATLWSVGQPDRIEQREWRLER